METTLARNRQAPRGVSVVSAHFEKT